jgi:neopullulanase
MVRFILVFIVFFGLLNCKNYAGSSAPALLQMVTVPVSNDLRVEPGNWWTGMQHRTVEIMVHRADVASYAVKLGPVKGIKLIKVEKVDSPNYLFLTLDIANSAKPQTVPLVFSKGTLTFTHPYPILARTGALKAQGVNSSDVIYLIFPDRFSNGDPSNDNVAGMRQGLQRDSLVGRHGGDLQGVINHLDYLQDLGISTIWLNPELENDQKEASYHGYAVTDHYQVDKRFGSNELLKSLVQNCHQRGMKVVRDVVLNHIGGQHWWMDDLPAKDWLNQWPTFTRTTYRAPTLVDPYASEWDKKQFTDGWFDYSMPDLNQRNPHVANYLIQQAIWWIEYAGIDDLRIDTYTYSDQAFCSRWCKELRDEYPNLGMFGEIWEHGVSIQGFFADDQPLKSAHFDSNLPGVVDFQLCFAIQEALTREQGWTEGAARIYYTLAKDRFYKNPNRNVVMLDNHDFTRFFTTIKEDLNKYKSGVAFLLTTRGIPQIYYATEILGTGNEWPSHGNIRKDFPGGWAGDQNNKFAATGRTPQENEAFNFMRTMLRYRNATSALQTGKLMQFVPVDGVYTYFRYDAAKTVMLVLNTSNTDKVVDTNRFAERMQGFSRAKNVVTGEVISNLSALSVGKNLPLVLELQ